MFKLDNYLIFITLFQLMAVDLCFQPRYGGYVSENICILLAIIVFGVLLNWYLIYKGYSKIDKME